MKQKKFFKINAIEGENFYISNYKESINVYLFNLGIRLIN